MTLRELISRFRTLSNDKVEPYFWSDEEITAWLNDGEEEACTRGRMLHEQADDAVCSIEVKAGHTLSRLHPSMYEVDCFSWRDIGANESHALKLVSPEELGMLMPDGRDKSGKPRFVLQDDTRLFVLPVPERDGTLRVSGYRLPLQAMKDDDDTPEIHAIHHKHLLNWVLFKGFSIPDTEMFDPNRAAFAEAEFSRYFGHQTDSDLRRTTREDVPHHTQAFWP